MGRRVWAGWGGGGSSLGRGQARVVCARSRKLAYAGRVVFLARASIHLRHGWIIAHQPAVACFFLHLIASCTEQVANASVIG